MKKLFIIPIILLLCTGFTKNTMDENIFSLEKNTLNTKDYATRTVGKYTSIACPKYYIDADDTIKEKTGINELDIRILDGSDNSFLLQYSINNRGYNTFYDKKYTLGDEELKRDAQKLYLYRLSNFNGEDFYNYYKENGTCPTEIHAYTEEFYDYDSNLPAIITRFRYFKGMQPEGGIINFRPTSTSIIGGNDQNTCKKPDASECYHYSKQNVPLPDGKQNVYFEIGKTTTGSNYLGVSLNSDLSNIVYQTSTGGVNFTNYGFKVQDETIYNNLSTIDNIYLECRKVAQTTAFYIYSASPDNYSACTETSLSPNTGGYQDPNDYNANDCDSILGNPKTNGTPAYYLQFAFNIMKYIAIVLLLVLTIIDFTKAIASNNQDEIKKCTQKAIKRFIIAVIIFLLPIIIRFILTILGVYSPGTCGIK